VSVDDVKEQVIELAREGFLLPLCPCCGIVLSIEEEALLEKCISCNSKFKFELIPWTIASSFPDA